ncbi:ABC transporter substrate-binding protein [Pseudomonas sp. NA-150]|uniref:ABC transporter substrate-binding protein n=1 Tax=Pseudomonas sp. NA-150 TaxID=3367525 RepID=UPI0037CB496F
MVSLSRRRLLVGAGALAAGGVLGSLPFHRSPLQPGALRVWRYKGSAASFIDLAGQADTPYPLEWVDLSGGNLVLEALNSGSLDYAYMSEIPPIFASIASVPLVIVARYKADINDSAIVVRKDAGIHGVADLRGKKISYVRATNTHYFVLNMLRQNGLSLDDVEAVPLPMQDALTAFRSGHIDALAAGGISVLQASESGGEVLENSHRYCTGNYLIATTRRVLDDPQRRSQVADFLRRERATWDWVNAHPERWAERSETLTGIDRGLYLQQFRLRSQPARLVAVSESGIASQQHVADTFYENHLIPRPVDVRPLWSGDFSDLLNS